MNKINVRELLKNINVTFNEEIKQKCKIKVIERVKPECHMRPLKMLSNEIA